MDRHEQDRFFSGRHYELGELYANTLYCSPSTPSSPASAPQLVNSSSQPPSACKRILKTTKNSRVYRMNGQSSSPTRFDLSTFQGQVSSVLQVLTMPQGICGFHLRQHASPFLLCELYQLSEIPLLCCKTFGQDGRRFIGK